MALRPINLTDISLSLHAGDGAASFFASAEALNTQYLRWLDVDRLLTGFRSVGGVPPPNGSSIEPYGGWCAGSDSCAWLGHLLSALAFAATSQRDASLHARSSYILNVLAQVADGVARERPEMAGWLGPAPWSDPPESSCSSFSLYGSHKLMAGLYDQYMQRGDARGRSLAIGLASFLHRRISQLVTSRGWSWWSCIFTEPGNAGHGFDIGGVLESVWNVYSLSGEREHLELASLLYNWPFFDPLLKAGVDTLHNEHANAHVPAAVGVARGAELTGNASLASIAEHFWAVLRDNYTFATGGSSVNEYWQHPNMHGDSFITEFNETDGSPLDSNGFHTQEMCVNYNTLKLLRHLLLWHGEVAMADSYERLLLNGVLGVQKPAHMGVMSYLTPLGYGVTRSRFDWWGWGAPDNAFWCCYGTSVESMAKLADSIFFEEATNSSSTGQLRLTVAQYVSSTLTWHAAFVNVSLTAAYRADASALTANVTLSAFTGGRQRAPRKTLSLQLRIPVWAVLERSSIDGRRCTQSGWHQVQVAPESTVRVVLGMSAWLRPINDARPEYEHVYSLMWGPLLLAGLTDYEHSLPVSPGRVDEWLKPVTRSATEATKSTCTGGYEWRQGALAKGDDLGAQVVTLAAAKKHCDNIGPTCHGFTYSGGRTTLSSRAELVFFKADTAANHSGWDMNHSWSTYLKLEPPPPNVGRVLEFEVRDATGNLTLSLLPLNRMVDQRYAVHFNLTGAAGGALRDEL